MVGQTPEQIALERIDKAIYEKAVELSLSNLNLHKLPPQIGQLQSLQKLALQGNFLRELPEEISLLNSLKELSLGADEENNNFDEFPMAIAELIGLEKLVLGWNSLSVIPPDISRLKNLKILNLTQNRLTYLPKEIGELSKLTNLSLQGNQVKEFPNEFTKLHNLVELSIGDYGAGNNISKNSFEIIYQLFTLESLWLGSLKLRSLPKGISNLRNLKILFLARNRLARFPEEISSLSNLEILYIHENAITYLPNTIKHLENLKSLTITENRLSSLPHEIGQLKNLTYFAVDNNNLTELPPEIGQLTNLRNLGLSNNQLTALPIEISMLTNLEYLSLDHNVLPMPFQILKSAYESPASILEEYVKSKQTTSKRNLRVFLCHSSIDKSQVRKVYKKLINDNIDAWLDEENLLPGQEWEYEIAKAVANSDAIIIFLSNNSVTKEGFVQKEIRFALDKAEEKPEGTIFIIPALLEQCEVPQRLSKRHWVKLFEKNGYSLLLKALFVRATNLGLN